MIIDKYKVIIFDSDGVLVQENKALPFAGEVTHKLHQMEKKIIVFSNNSTKDTETMKANYKKEGIYVDEVINSAMLVGNYCLDENIKDVYIVGEEGFHSQIKKMNININSENVDAVLIGMDRTLTYEKLATATHLIRKGARFIASNPDPSFPTKRGLEPGAGSMIAAIQVASDSEPEIIVGKPNTKGFEYILSAYNLKRDELLMIGDRFETDILGAIKMDIDGLIVNTGVAKSRQNPGKYENYEVEVINALSQLIS